MTKPSQEPADDYGYDLVHEESEPMRPVGWVNPAGKHPGAPAHRPVELDGDFGYDEAHDL
jgi:hypothetical protein